MPSNRLSFKKFFQFDIHDLGVMIGSGFFFGSVTSCVLILSMTPDEVRPYELGAAFTGFVLGRILSHKARRQNDV